jgi:predicted XRE-type DNA-binding protein
LGIAQLRLNALLRGKLDQFLDALVTMAVRAGLRVKLGIVR